LLSRLKNRFSFPNIGNRIFRSLLAYLPKGQGFKRSIIGTDLPLVGKGSEGLSKQISRKRRFGPPCRRSLNTPKLEYNSRNNNDTSGDLGLKAPTPINDSLSEKLAANMGHNLKGDVEDKNDVVTAQIHLNHNPNPNITKSWVRHGNHQKTTTNHHPTTNSYYMKE